MQAMAHVPTKIHLSSYTYGMAHYPKDFIDILIENFYLPLTCSREILGTWNFICMELALKFSELLKYNLMD